MNIIWNILKYMFDSINSIYHVSKSWFFASCEPSCFARKVSSVSPRSAKIWRLYPSQVTMQHGLSIQKLAKGKRWKMRRNAKRRCFREVAMTHLTWRRSWMLLMNCMGLQTHFSQLNWNLKGLQFCRGCRFQSMLPQWSNKRICISRFLIQITVNWIWIWQVLQYCLEMKLIIASVLLLNPHVTANEPGLKNMR